MDNKILRYFVLGLVLIFVNVLFGSYVSAFAIGVSGDLSLYPGQEFDAVYDVMNTIGGSEGIAVEGQILEGGNIVSFTKGNRFDVPAGAVVPVPVKYSVPDDAVVGTVYPIRVTFKTVSAGVGGGSVGFSEDVTRTFNIKIVQKVVEEKPAAETTEEGTGKKSTNVSIWLGLVIIVIIGLLMWWLIRKKNK